METNDFKEKFKLLETKYLEFRGIIDISEFNIELEKLRDLTIREDFWEDNIFAQKTLKKISYLENKIKLWSDLKLLYNDSEFYVDFWGW